MRRDSQDEESLEDDPVDGRVSPTQSQLSATTTSASQNNTPVASTSSASAPRSISKRKRSATDEESAFLKSATTFMANASSAPPPKKTRAEAFCGYLASELENFEQSDPPFFSEALLALNKTLGDLVHRFNNREIRIPFVRTRFRKQSEDMFETDYLDDSN